MIKRLKKFFVSLPFLFSDYKLNRWSRMSMMRKSLLAYPLFVFMSGIWQAPFLALVVGGVYQLGFCGLVLVYTSRHYDNQMRWLYLVLGAVMVVLFIIWIELLFRLVPHG